MGETHKDMILHLASFIPPCFHPFYTPFYTLTHPIRSTSFTNINVPSMTTCSVVPQQHPQDVQGCKSNVGEVIR